MLQETSSYQRPCMSKDTFVAEVEIIRSELEETEVVIEGEFVSRDTMINDWEWTEYQGIEWKAFNII